MTLKKTPGIANQQLNVNKLVFHVYANGQICDVTIT